MTDWEKPKMESPLEAVIELHKALCDLDEREALLSGIPDWMRDLHEEHTAHQEEIAAIEATLEDAASERRAAEAEIADHNERLKTLQEQISRVRNQREYGALLQEIDVAKNHIAECEERGIAALERHEEGHSRLESEREASKEVDQQYGEAMEKWEAQKPEISRQAEELKARVATLEAEVPPGILTVFQRIMERYGGTALAPIRTMTRAGKGPLLYHCGVCNYRVRPQAVVEVNDRGGIAHCDSCKRILYVERETE